MRFIGLWFCTKLKLENAVYEYYMLYKYMRAQKELKDGW